MCFGFPLFDGVNIVIFTFKFGLYMLIHDAIEYINSFYHNTCVLVEGIVCVYMCVGPNSWNEGDLS